MRTKASQSIPGWCQTRVIRSECWMESYVGNFVSAPGVCIWIGGKTAGVYRVLVLQNGERYGGRPVVEIYTTENQKNKWLKFVRLEAISNVAHFTVLKVILGWLRIVIAEKEMSGCYSNWGTPFTRHLMAAATQRGQCWIDLNLHGDRRNQFRLEYGGMPHKTKNYQKDWSSWNPEINCGSLLAFDDWFLLLLCTVLSVL